MADFDVIVIGAGPVGENVADYAHRGGLSVAVVESELVGGECSYWACIPSKALLRPVHALAAARRVDGAKSRVSPLPEAAAALGRRDGFISGYDDSAQASWVESAGITLVRGRGRLAGERTVTVSGPVPETGAELTAGLAVVVCAGSEAIIPPIVGLAESEPWTSRDVTGMTTVPRRLAVIGGGVVGCEMATAVAGLGAEEVTMLVRGDRLLSRMEPFASDHVLKGLRAKGVTVRLGTTVTEVHGGKGDASAVLVLDNGETVPTDRVLVATGRRARTGDLGVETVGLRPGEPLTTDAGLAVRGVPGGWLFAAGDVIGSAPLTHHGKYQARLLGDRLVAQAHGAAPDLSRWGRHSPTADDEALSQVIFTDPEVAAVGLTEAQAEERGLRTRQVTYDLGAIAGAALHADGYTGTASMLVDLDREVPLGMTFVGQDVAEMAQAASIAIVGEVPLDRLWHAVPAFPTVSEVWLRLMEEWRHG